MSQQPYQPENDPNQPPSYQPPPPPQAGPPRKRLVRTSWDSPISGVCGGLAAYTGMDATLVRVLMVVGAIVLFPAVPIAYVVAWAVMPKA